MRPDAVPDATNDPVYERRPFRVLIDHDGTGDWVPYDVYAVSVCCWSDAPLEIVTESSLVIRSPELDYAHRRIG